MTTGITTLAYFAWIMQACFATEQTISFEVINNNIAHLLKNQIVIKDIWNFLASWVPVTIFICISTAHEQMLLFQKM